ncbi:TetR/AcrR family transcriptional regulator [Streptomyces sp. RB6PN25]|uniref:TetR/AcrR family transcriptional regulator n=1 Tax=Streptomyces humicola TaxID=2953240 RepID=A0ABT1Q3J3_9ACTN|nr:TetR/AcrR family transcriptional regulator [Streptomyces humicola]MCQ4084492.1 TetR/AcrR family transcriptional regulator [Streptomyces humicola]
MPSTSQPRPRRTRLTPEREGELYEAVLTLLREGGYDALTMEGVAARSRSSKATLYRQWGTKPRLVAEALRHHRPFGLDNLDTGSLRGDLIELVGRIGRAKKDFEVLGTVAYAARQDEELAAALHAALVQPMVDVLRAMTDRAVARGEVAPDAPALPLLPHLLMGAQVGRKLVDRREPDAGFLTCFVDAVVLPALTQT